MNKVNRSKKVSNIRKELHKRNFYTAVIKEDDEYTVRTVDKNKLVLKKDLKRDDTRSYFLREHIFDSDSEFSESFVDFKSDDLKKSWNDAYTSIVGE